METSTQARRSQPVEKGAHVQFSEDRHQLPESLILERAMLVA